VTYYPCHYCKELLENKYLLHCTKPQCSRYFCLQCLNTRFDHQPKDILEVMKSPSWDCFVCRLLCTCRLCREKTEEITLPKPPEKKPMIEKPKTKLLGLTRRRGRPKQITASKEEVKSASPEKIIKKERKPSSSPTPNRKEKELEQSPRISKPATKILTFGPCHYCSSVKSDSETIRCSIPECGKRYCRSCIVAHINKNFQLKNCNPDLWICYACGKSCNCPNCVKSKGSLVKDKISPLTKIQPPPSDKKITGLKRKLQDFTSRAQQKDDQKFGSEPTKMIKPNQPSATPRRRGPSKPKSIASETKSTSISKPRKPVARSRKRSAKKPIMANTNTTYNFGSQSNDKKSNNTGVKIITEIKSDEYQLTIFDAESVEQLKLLGNGKLQ